MKLTTKARELKATLKSLKPWVPTKANHRIKEFVRIDTDAQGARITAFDGYTAICFPLYVMEAVKGACIVRFRDLMDCILKAETEITLEFDEISKLRISYGKTAFTLNAKPETEFIFVPPAWISTNPDAEFSFAIPFREFVNAVNHAYIASEPSKATHFTSGIYLDVNERTVNVVGTNGRRLHYSTIEAYSGQSDWSSLIESEVMKKLIKLPSESTSMIRICLCHHDETDYFSWQVGSIEGFTATMDMPYPEWKKVVPEPNGNLIEVSADDFARAVERMAPIARSEDGRDMIVLNGDGVLKISAKAESMGTGETELSCGHHAGHSMLVALNYVYLLDALNAHQKERIRITYDGTLEPVMIRSISDDSRSSILMPVRLPED